MKRILLAISASHEIGGAQKVFLTTIREILKKNYQVTVVLPKGQLVDQVQCLNVKMHIIDYSSPLSSLYAISRIIHREKIDIINTYLIQCSLLFAVVNLFYRRPICCTLLNAIIHAKTGKLQRIIYPFVYFMLSKICDGIIVNSEQNKKHFMQVAKIDTSRIKVIYSGIDTNEFICVPVEEKEKTKFIMGVVGRLSPEKGHFYLIEALSLVKGFDYECMVVGDGPLRQQLEDQVRRRNLQDKVTFYGFQSNVAQIMRQMDAVIVPSLNETFGITIIEAFALKIIVIASDAGGIPELVKHNITGLLFPSQDSSSLAQMISYVYANRQKMVKIVENSYKLLKENFTSSIMAENTLVYYNTLISNRTVRGNA